LRAFVSREEGGKEEEPQKSITDFFLVRRSDRKGMTSRELKVKLWLCWHTCMFYNSIEAFRMRSLTACVPLLNSEFEVLVCILKKTAMFGAGWRTNFLKLVVSPDLLYA